jgi:hypothetical protein
MTDPQDVAAEASTLSAGFAILTVQIFPFALPLLLLCIAPLLPLIVVGLLLAAIVYPPLRLVRYLRTRKRRSVSRPDSAEAMRSRPVRALGPP